MQIIELWTCDKKCNQSLLATKILRLSTEDFEATLEEDARSHSMVISWTLNSSMTEKVDCTKADVVHFLGQSWHASFVGEMWGISIKVRLIYNQLKVPRRDSNQTRCGVASQVGCIPDFRRHFFSSQMQFQNLRVVRLASQDAEQVWAICRHKKCR